MAPSLWGVSAKTTGAALMGEAAVPTGAAAVRAAICA